MLHSPPSYLPMGFFISPFAHTLINKMEWLNVMSPCWDYSYSSSPSFYSPTSLGDRYHDYLFLNQPHAFFSSKWSGPPFHPFPYRISLLSPSMSFWLYLFCSYFLSAKIKSRQRLLSVSSLAISVFNMSIATIPLKHIDTLSRLACSLRISLFTPYPLLPNPPPYLLLFAIHF